ncbi:signal peptide peptidase-like 2B isoform X2 [Acropora millepora]|uniref:signal peptide peptidase-like 2B isoform X2 n=2 Tax=Acropora millepora TaxID=45264 RepID=UPI001CF1DC80|nr:signal peptide peptidase-like 2B isoform X2 [Acropora millepora]
MEETGKVVMVLVFISFVTQVCFDTVNYYGVLHVEGTKGSQDFCITYALKRSDESLPVQLDLTPKYPLVEAKPPLLCMQAQDPSEMSGAAVAIDRGNCTFLQKGIYAQDSGAKEVIIVSNDTLFTPDRNPTNNFSIPMAVISHDDWMAFKKKEFGEEVHVQMYAPPTASIDGNLAILWMLAVCTVAIGAYWAGISNKNALRVALQGSNAASGNSQNNTKQEDEDASLEVTPWMVVIFVILICGTLLLLFYFYNYLVYVVIVLFCLAACNGFYECMRPIVLWLPLGSCKIPLSFIKNPPQIRIIFLVVFSLAISVWWGIERNKSYAWVLQDILGISFCISLIKNIRLPNLKVCTILLLLLLIYDIFFVFITPLFSAGKSVMVQVATGAGSKEQLPMVLKVPRLTKSTLSVCLRPYSLLGFGDILVPALYIGFCHTFDIVSKTPHKIYFLSTTIAYGMGLLITFGMLFVMEKGQPALLYLVPCTLGTGYAIGWKRGDIKRLWTGQMVLHNSGEGDDSGEDEIFSRGSNEDFSAIRGSEQETQRLINHED